MSALSAELTKGSNRRDFSPYRRFTLERSDNPMGFENLNDDRKVVISTNDRRQTEVQP
jgi:hypothetical protein